MIRTIIAEDDNMARRGILEFIPWKANGFEIVADVNNGLKALEYIQTNPVDLVITDLDMPIMNGIELTEHITSDHPDVSVVILSIHKEFEYIQKVLQYGAIDYIAKIDLDDDQVGSVLQRISRRIHKKERRISAHFLHNTKYSNEITQCIEKAIELTNSDLSHQWHVTEICKDLNISRSYFNLCFKDLVGQTYNDYLRSKRIEKAKELLMTDETIERIANIVGYLDEKYFSRIFRDSVGMLPSKFRSSSR